MFFARILLLFLHNNKSLIQKTQFCKILFGILITNYYFCTTIYTYFVYMKKLFYSAFAATFLTACAQQTNNQTYEINGTVNGVDGSVVVLLDGHDTLATETINQGSFVFTGNVTESRMVVAMIDREHNAQFILEPGKIALNLDNGEATGTQLNDELNALGNTLQNLAMEYRESSNPDSIETVYNKTIEDATKNHVGDPLGLYFIKELAYDMTKAELDSVMALCELYANDPSLQALAQNKAVEEATSPGHQYIDIEGFNALTSEALKLSDILAQGKPVIVDFWASWCGPCRREIIQSLSKYADEYKGKVNFVGIAVWENSVDDTKKAMSELPISWPVIYAGGRGDDSPTSDYGIMGIPHIMLVAPDGTIVARDLRGKAIEDAILNLK